MPLILNRPGYPSAWAGLRAEGPFQDAAKQIQSDLSALSSSAETRKVEGWLTKKNCEAVALGAQFAQESTFVQWCHIDCASLWCWNSTTAKGSTKLAFSTSSLDVCTLGRDFSLMPGARLLVSCSFRGTVVVDFQILFVRLQSPMKRGMSWFVGISCLELMRLTSWNWQSQHKKPEMRERKAAPIGSNSDKREKVLHEAEFQALNFLRKYFASGCFVQARIRLNWVKVKVAVLEPLTNAECLELR